MDEDEELFREMNEEDDFYMGDYDDQDDDTPDYDEIQHHSSGVNHSSQSNQGGGMGCLVMLPLLAGTLTFVVLLIL